MALRGPADAERYREALADCIEESDRVLVMLNTLMDISEAESGAMPLVRETLPLGDVLERAVDLYRDVAEAKGVALTEQADPDAIVSGDRVRLEQVAANLIDNAVKYTPRGGRVAASVRRAGDRVELVVEDTGRGHSSRRAAAHLAAAVPRRPQPDGARPRPRPEPRQGDR